MGFLLQAGTRVLTSVLALMWTRLLLESMGAPLYGLFLTFLSIASLGSLGDLGLGGAISLKTSQLLAEGRKDELQRLLANARSLFCVLAILVAMVFVLGSPWLPAALRFEPVPGAGSLPLLFACGAIGAGFTVLNSYIANVNYSCGNLLWSILPAFLILHASLAGHWLLARQGCPLWMQSLPYFAATATLFGMWWICLRLSHPSLAEVRPFRLEYQFLRALVGQSFWVYFYSLGGSIFAVTDRLLVNAGFGAATVPAYTVNYKLCELSLFVIGTATYVSMPKIAQWMLAPAEAGHVRARTEVTKLARFQALLGAAAALAYLFLNDWFITLWLGAAYRMPLGLQAAFAASLAVSAAGHASLDLTARSGPRGLHYGAIVVVIAAVLNLGLSLVAVRLDRIAGIAWATVVAQSVLTLVCGWYSSGFLGLSWKSSVLKNWGCCLLLVGLAWLVRSLCPLNSPIHLVVALASCSLFFLGVVRVIGVTWRDLHRELAVLRGLF
jgi:O-antigen/teichoic acid export membrane protein